MLVGPSVPSLRRCVRFFLTSALQVRVVKSMGKKFDLFSFGPFLIQLRLEANEYMQFVLAK